MFLCTQVKVNKNRKSITLKVNGGEPTTGRITRRVDVIAPIYVGGLPKVFNARPGLVSTLFSLLIIIMFFKESVFLFSQ